MKGIISVAMGELRTEIDNGIMRAVQNVGINVSKEELLKALELNEKLVMCEECKYRDDCEQEVLLASLFGEIEETAPILFCSYGERETDHE